MGTFSSRYAKYQDSKKVDKYVETGWTTRVNLDTGEYETPEKSNKRNPRPPSNVNEIGKKM